MVKKKSKSKRKASLISRIPLRIVRRTLWRYSLIALAIICVIVLAHRSLTPFDPLYLRQEATRLGDVDHQWVSIDEIAPVMARSVVAAEDANFCLHWGFDVRAIRDALDDGSNRGASTITQQVVKNLYLWHGRSWTRKAMEALLTPLVEVFWSKQRIIEVYLNIAEFDEGVFGVEAASRHYFGVGPESLSDLQAARLAAILPAPKVRSASKPNDFVRKRTRQIMDGAATIRRDGRSGCFED